MSEQNTDEKNAMLAIFEQAPTETTFFTINSQKAAEILGVNRTRLSQLTGQGLFPYERRKIDCRSRLFYRLNDLLNYQRKSSFGNLHVNQSATHPTSDTQLQLPPAQTISAPVRTVVSKMHVKNRTQTQRSQYVLKSALEIKLTREAVLDVQKLHAKMNTFETLLKQSADIIADLEKEISHLRRGRTLKRRIPPFS